MNAAAYILAVLAVAYLLRQWWYTARRYVANTSDDADEIMRTLERVERELAEAAERTREELRSP